MSVLILAFLLWAGVPQAATQARDAEAIAAAKKASVKKMDPALPDKPLGKWLRAVVGRQARITWEVNDCGEQTGNPEADKGRDFPMCAVAQVTLQRKRNIYAAFSVGTLKTGVQPGSVGLAYAVIMGPLGMIRSISKLSQLPKAIKASP